MSEKRRGLGRGLGALIPTGLDGQRSDTQRPVDVFFPENRRDAHSETFPTDGVVDVTTAANGEVAVSRETATLPGGGDQVAGAGTTAEQTSSTNGSGAFGASLNLLTGAASEKAYGEIANSYGTYNSRKNAVSFSTGKINDRVEIARDVGADGIHVGQGDRDVREVRDLVGPQAIVGLSVTNEAELARVPAHGVDYLGIGPVFATGTKPDHDPPVGLQRLSAMARGTELPSVAIGGIGLANAAEILASGVDGVAVVSAICAAPEPEDAARRLLAETARR